MGARQKLNRAHFNGALLCAAGAGIVTQSGFVFTIALIACMCWNYYDGGIRPDQQGKRR